MSRMSPSRKRSREQFKLKRLRLHVSQHPSGVGMPWLIAEPLPRPIEPARSGKREQPAPKPSERTGGQGDMHVTGVRQLDPIRNLPGLGATFDVLRSAGFIPSDLVLQFRPNVRDGGNELVSIAIKIAPQSPHQPLRAIRDRDR